MYVRTYELQVIVRRNGTASCRLDDTLYVQQHREVKIGGIDVCGKRLPNEMFTGWTATYIDLFSFCSF